ncbi:hypothetical protein QR680_008201 [Steinernema hermaphroditum]|uniref:Uncharacterized protein n=1 Tax=Steinernema hermaphroditum TaxID=289476 RepID=A0AA39IFS0_9BILA|nr:hypothetical protein QR680_008201 [Steinernema hermaphroditum]
MWLTFLIFLMSSRHVVASPPHGSSETSQDSRVRRAVPALSVSAISAPITAAGATLAMAFGGAAVAGSIVSSLVTWGALRDNEVLQAIEQVCSGKEQLCLRKLIFTGAASAVIPVIAVIPIAIRR